jgi:ABC-2 type transport system permease protein/capsular polysaccharide transport system permease protein
MASAAAEPGDTAAAIRRAWTIQRRVIWALVLREILTRYGRHNIGFLWLFAEPMSFTLGVTALWHFTKGEHGSSLPIVAFALTGYSTVLLWRNMPSRCITAIEPNLSLLYHRHVKVLDLFFARLTLEAMGATISLTVLACFFISIGMLTPPENVLEVIAGWLLIAWFGSALAMFVGALAYDNEVVDKIWHPVSYLSFPLSGAGFLVDALPKTAQKFFLYVPMVSGVEVIREGYFGSTIRAHYDVGYVVVVNAVLTLVALIRVRAIRHKIIPA